MPLYMDIHRCVPGLTIEALMGAHQKDVAVQKKYCVEYHKYWVDEIKRNVCCLVSAPDAETACRVHREAHGMVADRIIEIQPELAEAFLGGTEVNSAGAVLVPNGSPNDRDTGIRTIFFTDIVESTSLTQTLGDEAAMAVLDLHNDVVRSALAGLSGREVKHTGDGIMASFISAASAVKCAKRIQYELANHAQNQQDRPIKIRIGAAAGEPVQQHDDLFGSTVQLAARLCSHASPEQILVSNTVAELCLGKGFQFQEIGEVALKGFDRPVRAHAVDWKREAA
jgi:class 3 adenylate cyclase